MRGIVRNGMMAGLGAGLAQLGPMLARDQEAEERRAAAAEDAAARRAQSESNNARDNETRRLILEARNAQGARAGGGGGGVDMTPGGPAEVAESLRLAQGVGKGDVPTGRAVKNALVTGDRSAFEEDIPVRLDANDARAGSTTRGVSERTAALLNTKAAELQKISEEFAHGKDYDNVTKGRLNEQTRGIVGRVIDDPKIPDVNKAAVAMGKDLYGDGPSGIVGKFDGSEKPTARSRAATAEDNAQAGKAGGETKNADVERAQANLTRLLGEQAQAGSKAAGAEMVPSRKDAASAAAEKKFDDDIKVARERLQALTSQQGNKPGAPVPTPRPGPGTAPRRIGNSTVTPL